LFCPEGFETLVAVSNNLIRLATAKRGGDSNFPVYEYYVWKLLTFEDLMASNLWAYHPQYPMVKLTAPLSLRPPSPKAFPTNDIDIATLKERIPIVWEFASPETYIVDPWRAGAPETPSTDWEFLRPLVGWALCWKSSADAMLLKGFYNLEGEETLLTNNTAMSAVARTINVETKAAIALRAIIESDGIMPKAEAKIAVEADIGSLLGAKAFGRVWGRVAQTNPSMSTAGPRTKRRV
jgi:hypothetical protein